MKRNYKILSGGETPLPQLSDDQINKLYKEYIAMDGKHKNFKGTKREYCATVGSMIKKFLNGIIGANSLIGSGKVSDAISKIRRNIKYKTTDEHDLILGNIKLWEEAVPNSKVEKTAFGIWSQMLNDIGFNIKDYDHPEDRNKIIKAFETIKEARESGSVNSKKYYKDIIKPEERKTAAKSIIKKHFPDKQNIFNPTKEIIRGKTPLHNKVTGEYTESDERGVYNPFFRMPDDPRRPSFSGETPADKYDVLIQEVIRTRKIIKALVGDQTAQKNYIIALPYTNITRLTPEGMRERQELNDHLIQVNRPTNVNALPGYSGSIEWTPSTEASYRTEWFVFKIYLSNRTRLSEKESEIEEVKILGKILSHNMALAQLDYDFPYIKSDSKGKKTLSAFGEPSKAQVNIDKISALINSSYNREKGTFGDAEVLFTFYKTDRLMSEYNEDAMVDSRDPDRKFGVQAVFKFDIKKMMTSTKPGCKDIIDRIKDKISVVTPDPRAEYKKIVNVELFKDIRDLFSKYLTYEKTFKAVKREPELKDFPWSWYMPTLHEDSKICKNTCLNFDISKPEVSDYISTVVIAKSLTSGNNFPTPFEFCEMVKDHRPSSKYNSFRGETLDNYNVKQVSTVLGPEFEERKEGDLTHLPVGTYHRLLPEIGYDKDDAMQLLVSLGFSEEELIPVSGLTDEQFVIKFKELLSTKTEEEIADAKDPFIFSDDPVKAGLQKFAKNILKLDPKAVTHADAFDFENLFILNAAQNPTQKIDPVLKEYYKLDNPSTSDPPVSGKGKTQKLKAYKKKVIKYY